MQSIRLIRTALMVIALFLTINTTAICEVTVDPTGIAVWIEGADDAVELEMTLSNSGEDDVNYRLRYFDVDREENERLHRISGPRRDDPGETLFEIELDYAYSVGFAWDAENEIMYVIHATDARIVGYAWDGEQITDVTVDFSTANIPGGSAIALAYYDGVFFCFYWGQTTIYRYDTEGEQLQSIDTQWDGSTYGSGLAVDPETAHLYYSGIMANDAGTSQIKVYDLNDDFAQVGHMSGFEDMGENHNTDVRNRLNWVPEHENGHLWIYQRDPDEEAGAGPYWPPYHAWQLNVIPGEEGEWDWEVVQHFEVESDAWSNGIGHDGENLWIGNRDDNTCHIVDDGINEPNWLMADPQRGVIGANESETIDITITPGEIEEGVWEMLLRIDLRDAEGERDEFEATSIEMAVIMSYNTPVVQLSGHVTDAGEDHDDIANAKIEMDYYVMSRLTDEEGMYNFSDIPLGDYEFTFSADGYLPTKVEASFEEAGEVEINAELYHGECAPSTREITVQLEPDMEREVRFEVTNEGNGPLTYTVDRCLRGGADAEPWELRLGVNMQELLGDDMVAGAIFANGYFYISGGNNGDDPNKIYVLNMDMEVVGEFDQFSDDRAGMRDLTYDGTLIWGAAEGTFYGITTGGDLEKSFEFIPVDNFEGRYLAWDNEDSLLWVTDISANIYGITRDGELVRTIENNDLRIYGLAYWPDDPDDYNLYIFCRGPNNNGAIAYKMNLANGDYTEIIYLDIGERRPSGLQITNQLDIYSWVVVALLQNPDRLNVWQLDKRKDWFDIDPVAGVIEAQESQEFTLTLNSTGLPADNAFEGELVFTHDGTNGETIVSVILEVQLGRVETERTVQLRMGWNLVSVNLQPNDEENIIGLLAPLVDENQLIMMKNSVGEFYRPEYDYNDIPGWYANEGYQLLVSEHTQLTLQGITVLRDDPIDLHQGWQAVSYYPNIEIEATVALSGIVDHLVIAKDGSGRFYLPAWDHFSTMGDMRPGQGYWINVDEAVRLVYQMGEENDALFGNLNSKPSFLPSHPNTSENMSLLTKCDPALKGEIGVYAGGTLVGSGVLNDGLCGLAIWGDDKITEPVDGALDGELLEIRYYSGDILQDAEITILAGEMTYHKDTYAVIDLAASVSEIPSEFGIMSAYPNPFNSQTRITYSLPEESFVDLAVFDLSGRRISQLTGSRMYAGMHTVTFNATEIPSGIYFIHLNACGQQSEWKVALVK